MEQDLALDPALDDAVHKSESCREIHSSLSSNDQAGKHLETDAFFCVCEAALQDWACLAIVCVIC